MRSPIESNDLLGRMEFAECRTGAIFWQTGNPVTTISRAEGPVSVANQVVFGGSYDLYGYFYPFNARTGAILWRSLRLPADFRCSGGERHGVLGIGI